MANSSMGRGPVLVPILLGNNFNFSVRYCYVVKSSKESEKE